MTLTLGARLAVVAVLAYSGLSKWGAADTARAAEDFGLSRAIAKWVGRWLALAELVVAGLLIFSITAYAGALAALVLFTSFACLVMWNLWQGRKPPCACFGEASSDAISNWTAVRNLLFVALAAIVASAGPAGLGNGLVADLALSLRSMGIHASIALLALVQGVVFLMLWTRRVPQASVSVPVAAVTKADPVGWPPGTLAPAFDLPSVDGSRQSLASLLSQNRALLLFFTSPDCRHCEALLPEIARWQDDPAAALTVALLSRGTAIDNRSKAEEYGVRNVLLQGGSEIAEAYQALATPVAVIVDQDRRIASRLATGATEIRRLVEAWTERLRHDAPLSVLSPPPPPDPIRVMPGDPAPPFKLASIRGGDVDLADLSGRLTVLTFWSPSCGYCRAFAPVLRERERAQTDSSAQIVFVATGTSEANAALGFVSPVLLDDADRTVGRAYGVNGTPSAILVDAEGKLASSIAAGQADIEALLARADVLARAARRVVA